MNPEKKLSLSLRVVVQPGSGAGDDLVSSALSYGRTGITGDRGPIAGVVSLEAAVESLCQPVPRVEIDGANKGGGPVGLRLQQVREVKQR